MTLDELRESDFWSFFNVRETGRSPSGNGLAVTLATGGFAEHIALAVSCDTAGETGAAGDISAAVLHLRRSWVTGPPWGINPLANDITASWLTALVPAADKASFTPLVDEIRSLRAGEEFKAKVEDQAWLDSSAGRLAIAYVGVLSEPFACRGETTYLTVGQDKHPDGTDWTVFRLRFLSPPAGSVRWCRGGGASRHRSPPGPVR